MKFRITFKTPDAVEHAISQELGDMKNELREKFCNNLDDCVDCQDELHDELQEIQDAREKAEQLIEKFVKHGELITIEFDTDAETATVVKI